MYELIKLSENDYYMDTPSKIGIIKTGYDEVIFIDSGNSKDTAKKALKIIGENGWKLKAVYNTHSHADHIGGNKFLQDKTGCKIYAYGAECAATNYPVSETAMLYGGYPFPDVMHKFLLAEKSYAEPLTESVLPQGFSTVDLSGHCYEMVGYITPDGNAFIGDAVVPEEILTKYGVSYVWNFEDFLNSLNRLKTVVADKYIPSHGDVYDSITEIADFNIKFTEEFGEKIIELCGDGISFDNLLKKVFDYYGMDINAVQHILTGSTLRSYLSLALKEGKIKYSFSDNIMIWSKA